MTSNVLAGIPRSLALVAAGALALGACLIAPPPPAGDGDGGPGDGGGGDGGGACPALAGLTADDALPVALTLPAGDALDDLVRGGAVGGRPALLVHQGGAAFSPTCPDRHIDLGEVAAGSVVAVTPHGPGHVLVVATTGTTADLVDVDLASGAAAARALGSGFSTQGEPGLASDGARMRLAQGVGLFGADLTGGVASAELSPLVSLDDPILAVAAVDPATTGHGWVLAGLGAAYTLGLEETSATAVLEHGLNCTATVQSACVGRNLHVVTSSRLAAGDGERVVAVSMGRDGSVITLQNRAVPTRRGFSTALPTAGIDDVEVTDLVPLGPPSLRRLFVAHEVADQLTLSHATLELSAADGNVVIVGAVAQLPVGAMLGPARLATGRFVEAAATRTLVLGRSADGGLAATCVDTGMPAVIGC